MNFLMDLNSFHGYKFGTAKSIKFVLVAIPTRTVLATGVLDAIGVQRHRAGINITLHM
jgi:hypothetical protein